MTMLATARVCTIGQFPSEGQRAFAALGDKRIVIATVLGVSVPYVCQLMSGVRRPSLEMAFLIQRRLGIDARMWQLDGQEGD